jgi:hypothetical protein
VGLTAWSLELPVARSAHVLVLQDRAGGELWDDPNDASAGVDVHPSPRLGLGFGVDAELDRRPGGVSVWTSSGVRGSYLQFPAFQRLVAFALVPHAAIAIQATPAIRGPRAVAPYFDVAVGVDVPIGWIGDEVRCGPAVRLQTGLGLRLAAGSRTLRFEVRSDAGLRDDDWYGWSVDAQDRVERWEFWPGTQGVALIVGIESWLGPPAKAWKPLPEPPAPARPPEPEPAPAGPPPDPADALVLRRVLDGDPRRLVAGVEPVLTEAAIAGVEVVVDEEVVPVHAHVVLTIAEDAHTAFRAAAAAHQSWAAFVGDVVVDVEPAMPLGEDRRVWITPTGAENEAAALALAEALRARLAEREP